MKPKMKLFLLELFGFIVSIAPLGTALIVKWDSYIQTPQQAVKLGFGGVIVAALILLKVLDRLKISSSVTVVATVMVLSYLLESVLADLTLLCGMYLIGEVVEKIFFARPAKKIREQLQIEKQADATADRVEDLIKTYIGNGRV